MHDIQQLIMITLSILACNSTDIFRIVQYYSRVAYKISDGHANVCLLFVLTFLPKLVMNLL